MSRLSSDSIAENSTIVTVIEKLHAVDVEISLPTPSHNGYHGSITGSSSSTINVVGNIAPPIAIQDAVGSMYASTVSSYTTVGFRFFFEKGYLKCLKREVSGYNLAIVNTSASPTSAIVATVKNRKSYRETFYHPYIVVHTFGNRDTLQLVLDKVLNLASRKGITVPEKFLVKDLLGGFQSHLCFTPALDWLTFPLIREIDDVAVAVNLNSATRMKMSPTYDPKNFKELVDHYYGTSTSKMLEEIWKVIAIGPNRHSTVNPVLLTENMGIFDVVARNGRGPVIEIVGDTYIQYGPRNLNIMAFLLGPAIFKTMGFDYLYQALPLIGNEPETGTGIAGSQPWSATNIDQVLNAILKSVAPKKLINKLCNGSPDMYSLVDTGNMLIEYGSPDNIPKSLKSQYPDGLRVDFKFKDMKELHDKISTQYTIIKTEAQRKDIPVHPIYAKLDGMERNGLRLVVPHSTTPLAMWGKALHICVASYGDRAAHAQTLLLGVEKDGEIKYCIEFSSSQVNYIDPEDMMMAHIFRDDELPSMEGPKMLRAALPYLEEHQSIVPPDVSDEEGIFQMPSIIQFRSEYNRDPSSEDKSDVHNMLVQWVHENKEDLNKILREVPKGAYHYNIQAMVGDVPVNNRNNYNGIIQNYAGL